MLETTLAMVQRSAVDEIVLVLGASAETIRSRLAVQDVTVIVNQAYAQGMAGSLQAGISALSPRIQAALIILADQPFVRSQTLDHLIAEYRRARSRILIPTYQGHRGNPVLVDRRLFPQIMELQGDVGCRAIFTRHPQAVQIVEVKDEGILLDIDQQEDYQRLKDSIPARGSAQ